MYNLCVLTRTYQHLTFVALTGLHWIMCVLHNVYSISIVGFGDSTDTCRNPYEPSETNLLQFDKSYLAIWQSVCSSFKPFNITMFSNIVWHSTVVKHSIIRMFKNRLWDCCKFSTAYLLSQFEFFTLFTASSDSYTLGYDATLLEYQINAW